LKTSTLCDAGSFRFSEVLSALSLALDLVEGQPGGPRRPLVPDRDAGGRPGLDAEARSALFYAFLLKDAGCSSNASRMSSLFDADGIETKKMKTADWTSFSEAAPYTARRESGRVVAGQGRPDVRVHHQGPQGVAKLFKVLCERGAEITRLMGFPEETARAIRSLDEHWDGKGHPDGLKGEAISPLARICGLALTVEIPFSAHGRGRGGGVRPQRALVRPGARGGIAR
jgi:hypothetical protein